MELVDPLRYCNEITTHFLKNIYEEDWLRKEIGDINTKNPQIAANRILDAALSKSGKKADDDMTVAVSIISKNV